MILRRWWRRFVFDRFAFAPVSNRKNRFRPRLEALEDRLAPAVQLISGAASGTSATANGASIATNLGSISDDGRFSVYLSKATNLVSGQSDTNGVNDVFLYDNETHTTRLISRQDEDTAGNKTTAGNAIAHAATISGDGNWVAFISEATNLVDGVSFSFSGIHVYLYDVVNDSLQLITYKAGSTTVAASADSTTAAPSLSNDGRYLAFVSGALDLIDGQDTTADPNGMSLSYPAGDAFLYDRLATGEKLKLISHIPTDSLTGGNEATGAVAVSGDGSAVAFTSYATNLGQDESRTSTSPDIFRYDVSTGAVTLVSFDANATNTITSGASQSDRDAFPPSISDDGRYITYVSMSDTLVEGQVDPGDTVSFLGFTFTQPNLDVFLYDASTGTNTLVSLKAGTTATAAGAGSGFSQTNRPVISADGAWVTFSSPSNNLLSSAITAGGKNNVYLYKVSTGELTLVSHTSASSTSPASGDSATISDDGRYVTFASTTSAPDIYRYDATDGSLTLISHTTTSESTASGGINSVPSISGDGTTIVWTSTATNLVANDTNAKMDVFLAGQSQGTTNPLDLTISATSIDEGQKTTLTGTLTGGTSGATYTLVIDWGNGTETFNNVAAGSFSFDRLYKDDNPTNTAKDNQPIKVTVTGQNLAKQTTIEVRNVVPQIQNLSVTTTTENGEVTLTGDITDPGVEDTFKLKVTWGDGSEETFDLAAGSTSFSVKHKYLDDDPTNTSHDDYTIGVNLTDDDTGATSGQTVTTVFNAAPQFSSLSATNADENGTVTLTGNFTDVGTKDTFKVKVVWGDGQEETFDLAAGSTSFTRTHQYLDDDPTNTPKDDYTIVATLTDDDTGVATEQTTTTISNVAPTIGNLSITNADENGTVTLTGTITDPGTKDTFKLEINWADGSTETIDLAAGSTSFSATHKYLDDDPTNTPQDDYTVVVKLTDDDTGVDTDQVTTTITNVAPTIGNLTVTNADENGSVTLKGTITDPGTKDTFKLEINWADGQTQTIDLPAGSTTFEVTHQYLDDDPTNTAQDDYTIAVKLTDDDTGVDTEQVTTTITNVAPVFTNLTVTNTNENGSVTLKGTFKDPGTKDTFKAEITWGDGSTQTIDLAAGSTSFEVTHKFLDDDPTNTTQDDYTINVKLLDDDTGSATASVTATVFNVAPALGIVTVTDTKEDGSVTLTGTFTDPGTLDTHKVTVKWGDGNTQTIDLVKGARTFELTHKYLDDDPTNTAFDVYTLDVTVTDDDRGSDTVQVFSTVTNVAPVIGNVTITDTLENGFVTLKGGFADPGTLDTHKVIVNWGDGNIDTIDLVKGGRDFELVHQYLDDDPSGTAFDFPTVSVTVKDDDTGSDSVQVSPKVTNVAPLLGNVTVTDTNEHGFVTLTGAFVDPGTQDTHRLTVTWGDGTFSLVDLVKGAREFEVVHQYLDDDPTNTAADAYTINLTLADDDLGVDAAQVVTTVTNVEPVLANLAITNINENGFARLTGDIVDPGTLDTFKLTIDWDDGTVEQFDLPAGTTSFAIDHRYLDDDPTNTPQDNYTVDVTLDDDDLGRDLGSVVTTVSNVAPQLLNLKATDTFENGVVELTGTIKDPGTLDTFKLFIDWGDEQGQVVELPAGTTTFTVEHVYTDDNPTGTAQDFYVIDTQLKDDDGGETGATTGVVITNVAPTFLETNVIVVDPAGTIQVTGTFLDPGLMDTHKLTIDWGDGTFDVVDLDPGARVFNEGHQYDVMANYKISIILTDDDLGTTKLTRNVFADQNQNVGPGDEIEQVGIDQGGQGGLGGVIQQGGQTGLGGTTQQGTGGVDNFQMTVQQKEIEKKAVGSTIISSGQGALTGVIQAPPQTTLPQGLTLPGGPSSGTGMPGFPASAGTVNTSDVLPTTDEPAPMDTDKSDTTSNSGTKPMPTENEQVELAPMPALVARAEVAWGEMDVAWPTPEPQWVSGSGQEDVAWVGERDEASGVWLGLPMLTLGLVQGRERERKKARGW